MCTKPLKGFKYGQTKNGKDSYIIASFDTDHIEISKNGSIVKAKDHFISDTCKIPVFEYTEIPCGKCLDCRLRYAKLWSDRCMLEAQQYEKNCFVTLTYDDDHLPKIEAANPITGEIQRYPTLVKKDLQDFMKRLRKAIPDVKIRYFASGEYGEKFLRPHYHLMIFNWSPDFTDPLQVMPLSNKKEYYSSYLIEKEWTNGNNVVAPCTWETCNYVARYVVKKYPHEKNEIYETGIQKEFVTMSRKPGIGLEWLNSHYVCYATFLHQYLKTENGSIKVSPNRYFDTKMEDIDPEVMEEIKRIRKEFSKETKKAKYFQSDLSYLDQLQVEAANLERKTKILKGQII